MSICAIITRRGNSGAAYLMAVITLVVGFMLGLALLRMVGGATLQGGNRVDATRATYLADAGINYAYWKYRYCGVSLPYTETRQMGKGSFTITISDNAALRDTVKIASTGRSDGLSQGRQRVVRTRIRPSEWALMLDSGLTSWWSIDTGSSGQNGDVYVNGSLILNAAMGLNGRLCTAGYVYNGFLLSATASPLSASGYFQFPAIDLTYYASAASRTYSGDQTFYSGLTFNVPYEVVYINGKLTIKGTISGKGLIVVNGNVEVTDELLYANSSTDKMAMVITGSLTTKAANNMVDGFYLIHNDTGTAWFKAEADITFRKGGLAADSFSSVRKLRLTADPEYKTTDLGYRMHLPGYETADVSNAGNQVVVTD